MKNFKGTKKALLMSALSLLLCCAMLIGTTFAWFTDSEESGINKIVAGNLDVELYHGKEILPTTDEVDGATNIFTDASGAAILWEPGAVAYTNLNVVNKGTLALKYQLAISFDNENYIMGTNAKLSQVLKVAFLDTPVSDAWTREQMLSVAKAEGDYLTDLVKAGEMHVQNENKVFGVVVYWEPSEDDNNWNVFDGATTDDGQALHIDLGISLIATQLPKEFDSFGSDYDGEAVVPVSTANDLQAALDAGATNISVNDNIDLGDATLNVPAAATTFSLRSVPAVTINLNGNKITTTASHAIQNGGNLILKNGAVESRWYAVRNNGTLTVGYGSVIDGIYNSGAVTVEPGSKVFTDYGNYNHAIYHAGTSLVINGGEFSGNGNEVISNQSTGDEPVIINGGTFKKVGKSSYLINGKNNMIINGGAFFAFDENDANPAAHPVTGATILGGTFNYRPATVGGERIIKEKTDGTWSVGRGVANSLNGTTAAEIKFNEEQNTVLSLVVPAGAVAEPDKEIEVFYAPSEYAGNFTVEADESTHVVEVTVSNLADDNTTPIVVTLKIPAGLDPNTVKLYHYDTQIDCTYNPNTGDVTFETTSFSPFTVVYEAESEYIPPIVENGKGLPVADVQKAPQHVGVSLPWGKYGQWSPNDEVDADPKLEAAYIFTCEDTAEEAMVNAYANWYCDFYVKLSCDLGENEIFLGGNYGSFGWVGFHNGDVVLDANTEIPLLGSVTSNPWTYADVANFVGTFTCGVGDVNDALSGATFTVMLRLTNPENEAEFYNVATITHTFQ